MHIYNTHMTNFMARKTMPVKKVNNIIQEPKTLKDEPFYNDIEKYLKKEINKEEYLKLFVNNFKQNNFKDNNDILEKKYINDLLTSIDLINSYKEIPDNYITERMLNLLQNKK